MPGWEGRCSRSERETDPSRSPGTLGTARLVGTLESGLTACVQAPLALGFGQWRKEGS